MYSLSWLALKSFNFLSEIFGFHQLRQRYFERCKFSLFQVYDNFDWLRVTAQAFLISRFLFRPHPIFIQSFNQFLFHLDSPGVPRGRRAPLSYFHLFATQKKLQISLKMPNFYITCTPQVFLEDDEPPGENYDPLLSSSGLPTASPLSHQV